MASEDIQENGESEEQKQKKNKNEKPPSPPKEEYIIVPPKPPEPARIMKAEGFRMQTNLPPEYAIAALPHIDSEERKLLIEEMGKENQRIFEVYQMHLNFQKKDSRHNKWLFVFCSILFAGLMIYCLSKGHETFFERILTLGLGGFGGGGIIILYIYKTGLLKSSD